MKNLANELEKLMTEIIMFGKKFIIALLVYFIGKKLMKWLMKIVDKSIQKSNLEQSVAGFLNSVVKALLYALLIITIVGILGLPTSSLVALIGSAGLTIGLAFQGSLSNFAGGILILLIKPFRVGDYIIANGNEGTVSAIDLFYTRLTTADNKMIVLPNGTLSNSNIINVTSEPIRRLDLIFQVAYSENITRVKEILFHAASSNTLVRKDYDIDIFVDKVDSNAITLGIRMWVDTDHYWNLRIDMMERIKEAFDQNHITIPNNKLDINLAESKLDTLNTHKVKLDSDGVNPN